jgi:hypothetical protein
MKLGLIPKFPCIDEKGFPDNHGTDEKAVFFWDCLALAQIWAEAHEEIVIEACISSNMKKSRRLSCLDTYEYLVYEKIPPKELRVVPSDKPKNCKKNCIYSKGCFYFQIEEIRMS